MPLFTPSRLAVVVISCSLFTFLWTYGLPRPLAVPALPIIGQHDYFNVHKDRLTPTPAAHATAQAHATGVTEDGDGYGDDDGERGENNSLPNTPNQTNGTNTTVITEEPHSYEEVLQPPTHEIADFCKGVRGAQHVMVVVRTSKAEIKDKMPAHLKNLLECVPNFAFFSDHSGEIDGYKVHNALESIRGDTKRAHNEFREYQLMHADAEHKTNAGKTMGLDKWKFLPMVYNAYHLRPSTRFFVFIEADTSLSWTNLLQWVGRLDYRIPYYSTAPTSMDGTKFSQRGSGIMLSQGALRRYVKSYDELYTSTWEGRVAKGCCGDLALSSALEDARVEFYSAWPMLQDKRPDTLDYTKKLWCVPAISWHRVNGSDLSDMWEKEKAWIEAKGWGEPYLYRDAFHDHVESQMEIQKDEWDNQSQDAKIIAPQGRQLQLKEEAERRRKHEEEERRKHEEEERKKHEEEGGDKHGEEGGDKHEEEGGDKDKEEGGQNHREEEQNHEAEAQNHEEEAQNHEEEVQNHGEEEDQIYAEEDGQNHEKGGGQAHKEEGGQKKATEKKKTKQKEQAEKDRKKIQELISKEPTKSGGPNPTQPKPKTKVEAESRKTKPTPKSKPASRATLANSVDKREDEKKAEKPDWKSIVGAYPDAGDSSENCQKACLDTDACLQWRYTTAGDGECHLGGTPRLGKKTEGHEKWVSGWFQERVDNIKEKWECEDVNWKFYQ